jgi:hypothetical protein
VKASGSGTARQRRSYQCPAGHVRRDAGRCDDLVMGHLAAWIDRDAADLLPPPVRAGVDVAKLRAEERKLTRIGQRQAEMHAVGEITDAEFRAGSRARRARLDSIAGQFDAETGPDRLAEFRGQRDAAEVLAGLALPRQRAIVRDLVTIVFQPSAKRGAGGFDPDSVEIAPAAAAAAAA